MDFTSILMYASRLLIFIYKIVFPWSLNLKYGEMSILNYLSTWVLSFISKLLNACTCVLAFIVIFNTIVLCYKIVPFYDTGSYLYWLSLALWLVMLSAIINFPCLLKKKEWMVTYKLLGYFTCLVQDLMTIH